MKVGFVIPTKDRPEDLARLLRSLEQQEVPPAEVVVIDASAQPVQHFINQGRKFPIRFIRHLPPCASRQRNVGAKSLASDLPLIGFLDDDIVLEPGALQTMLDFWTTAAADVAGASFNYKNPGKTSAHFLKRSALVNFLGLYSSAVGGVAPSGWHTMIQPVEEITWVDWFPSAGAVFRRETIHSASFDETLHGYSYLEDLDFTYSISRKKRLAIVAGPGYLHLPSPRGRPSGFQFGRIECINRRYFVRKHRLSLSRCYAGLAIRFLLSLAAALLNFDRYYCQRACGNLAGFFSTVDRA